MQQIKHQLLSTLAAELEKLSPGAGSKAAFESPKQASHGDLATNAAMQLAKPLKQNPRALGEQLKAARVAAGQGEAHQLVGKGLDCFSHAPPYGE